MYQPCKTEKKEYIKNLWESQLQEIFSMTEKTNMESFISILSMIMYEKFDEKIANLYAIVNNLDLFTSIVNTFSGVTLVFPDREKFKESIVLALSYYYKEVKGMDWEYIKKELPFDDILLLKAGKNLNKLNKLIKKRIKQLLVVKEK
jgi:hypothetical protein